MEPKKTSQIYAMLPDGVKIELREPVRSVGMSESAFLRACAEALIVAVRDKERISLPVLLVTVGRETRARRG